MTQPSWFARRHPQSPLASVSKEVGVQDWEGATTKAFSDLGTRAVCALVKAGYLSQGDMRRLKEIEQETDNVAGVIAEAVWAEVKARGDSSTAVETAMHLLSYLAEAQEATRADADPLPPDRLIFLGMEIATLGELLTVLEEGILRDAAATRAVRQAQRDSAAATNRINAANADRIRRWIVSRGQDILDTYGLPREAWDAKKLANEVFREWIPVPANDQDPEDRLPDREVSHATVKRTITKAWNEGGLRLPPSKRR